MNNSLNIHTIIFGHSMANCIWQSGVISKGGLYLILRLKEIRILNL